MTEKELKTLAIDYNQGRICCFNTMPFEFEYYSKSSERGFFTSNRSLSEADTIKFNDYLKQFHALVTNFLND